jgi:hypothetical protein
MTRRVMIGAVAALCAATSAFAADDWRMWNTYSFKLPLVKNRVDLNASMDTRFRDDMDEFYRYHFYVGPDFLLNKFLTMGWQYGNIQEGDPGDFHTEHRFMHFLTPKFKLKDLGLKDSPLGDFSFNLQNRLDWRFRYFKEHKNTWQYRFYPKVSYPVYKGEKLEISPYVGDAFYFDLTNGIAFRQNRIYSGLAFKLFKHLTLEWYYMRLAERSGRGGPWDCSHVIGTVANYAF